MSEHYARVQASLDIDIDIDWYGYDDPDCEIPCDYHGDEQMAIAQVSVGDAMGYVFAERSIRELCRQCIDWMGDELREDLLAVIDDE